MTIKQKQNFILSYAIDLIKIQIPMCTVVSGSDECLIELIRSIDLYQKVHKINLSTDSILNDMREIFGHRQTEEVEWVDDTKLMITDFETIDDQQLNEILNVKTLVGVDCMSQDVALRRLKHDLSLAKSHSGFDAIKQVFYSDLEFNFNEVEKAVLEVILDAVNRDKNLDLTLVAQKVNDFNQKSDDSIEA